MERQAQLKVNEMLDNVVDDEHYVIKWHYFRDEQLILVVQNDVSGFNISVKAKGYKLDSLYTLAPFIYARHFSTSNTKPWVQWADQHFKRVTRLYKCMASQVPIMF